MARIGRFRPRVLSNVTGSLPQATCSFMTAVSEAAPVGVEYVALAPAVTYAHDDAPVLEYLSTVIPVASLDSAILTVVASLVRHLEP